MIMGPCVPRGAVVVVSLQNCGSTKPCHKRHEPDVNNVVKLCDMHNIPMATNLATAELLIKSLDRGDLEWREMYK